MKRRVGRRSKLTAQLQKKICEQIEEGNTFDRACRLCNISDRIFYKWREQGKEAKRGKFFQFFQAVKRAEERFIAWHLKVIKDAAEAGTWQAAAWILERKYFEEFGRKDRHEVTGKEGGPIHLKYEPLLDDKADDRNDK